ncbi:MAG: hypothetical protein M3R43_10220 [Acidobacteriota bacterium]|nr:hypothetical protein [Acidobacteriota bacterium]
MTSRIFGNTDSSFAHPSFASGFARGLDMFGTFDDYNTFPSEAEADEQAIASDWFAVGEDLRRAFEGFEGK